MTGDPLAAWKTARAQAGGRLVHTVWRGDSTMAGETLGMNNLGTPAYSPVTRVRQRLAAAGLVDGGHGFLNGAIDVPSVSGEPADAGQIAMSSPWDITDTHGFKVDYHGGFDTPGKGGTIAVYGTQVRVGLARYGVQSVIDIDIDGQTTRVTMPIKPPTAFNADGSGNWSPDFVHFPGLTYGRHVVTVTLVSGALNFIVEGTRNAGVVLHNFSGRGSTSGDSTYPQLQDWMGLQVTAGPNATPAPADTRPGSRRPALAVHAMGINDPDASVLYTRAKAFADAAIYAGASAIIARPWLESAPGDAQGAADKVAALVQAAADTGALLVDLSPTGALANPTENIGGSNSNPHLTPYAYQLQGDYLADILLAGYVPATGPVVGRWDGTTLQPVTVGRWDGTVLQPVTITVG